MVIKEKECNVFMVACFVLLVTVLSHAETRIWKDKEGNEVEAELVKVSGSDVYLRSPDGKELKKVKLEDLSPKDQKYAQINTPPKLRLSVSVNTDRRNESHNFDRRHSLTVQKEEVQCEATVEKASSDPYEPKLKAILFTFGTVERKDLYVVLDRTLSPFSFGGEAGNTHRFEGGEINLRQTEFSSADSARGVEYEGYVLLVVDVKGNLLDVKGSRSFFEKNVEKLNAMKRGDLFDEDFNLVTRKEKKEERKKEGFFPAKRRDRF